MNLVGLTCGRENTTLKDQLVALGYEVPRTVWSMSKPPPKGGVPLGQSNGHTSVARQSIMAANAAAGSQLSQNRQSSESREIMETSGHYFVSLTPVKKP